MKNQKIHFLKNILLLVAVLFIATPDGFSEKSKAKVAKVKVNSKVARDFKKFGKEVRGVVKKIGNDAGKFLKEIKSVTKCIPKIVTGLVHLAENPRDKQAFNSLQRCMDSIKQMSNTCDQPEIMALSAVPDLGSEIAMACNEVGKFEIKLQMAEQEFEKAETFASNPVGASEHMAMNQVNGKVNEAQRQVTSKAQRQINSSISGAQRQRLLRQQ